MPNDPLDLAPPPSVRFCARCGAELAIAEHAGRSRPACPREGCGFVHWGNPTPVVAAIVEVPTDTGAGIVLVRAHGWPEKLFGLVTGFLEAGETPEEGVLREVEEELGLRGDAATLIGVYAFPQRNELLVAFHVRARGEPVLGAELSAHRIIPADKLRPWPFGTGLAVRDWLARRTGQA